MQDEGSQIVADLAGAREGEQVLDYCAGGGGKTLAMAASMNNKGQVHAFDADRKRLAPIIERLKRAGTRNVQVHDRAAGLAPFQEKFDRVLVDAPCTGTGTWRRRPDTKWRLTARNLEERVQQQGEALSQAKGFVRPGGESYFMLPVRFCPRKMSSRSGASARKIQNLPSVRLWSAGSRFSVAMRINRILQMARR